MRAPLILASTALALSALSSMAAAQQPAFPTLNEYLSSSGGDQGHYPQHANPGSQAQWGDPVVRDLEHRIVHLERIISSLSVKAQGDSGIDVEDLINARIDAIDQELSGILSTMAGHFNSKIAMAASAGSNRVASTGLNRAALAEQARHSQSQRRYFQPAASNTQAASAYYTRPVSTAPQARVLSRSSINLNGQACEMIKRTDESGHVVTEVGC